MFNSNKLQLILGLSIVLFSFQQCKVSKPTTVAKSETEVENLISYERHIKPMLLEKCTPCHFPEQGTKKMLDTYQAVSKSMDDIILRVELDPSEKGYMPFKSKKPALTAEEIQTLKDWVSQGMSE